MNPSEAEVGDENGSQNAGVFFPIQPPYTAGSPKEFVVLGRR